VTLRASDGRICCEYPLNFEVALAALPAGEEDEAESQSTTKPLVLLLIYISNRGFRIGSQTHFWTELEVNAAFS
jgi:hypothetical protein